MRVTTNSDTMFLITDEFGNVPGGSELGLYHEDTRYLSRYSLTLDATSPVPLSSRQIAATTALHVLANAPSTTLSSGQIMLMRHQTVRDGLREHLTLTNFGDRAASVTVGLHIEADFCHLFDARDAQFHEPPSDRLGQVVRTVSEGGHVQHLRISHESHTSTLAIRFSQAPSDVGGVSSFALQLAPGERWQLTVEMLTLRDEQRSASVMGLFAAHERQGERHDRYRRALLAGAPVVESDSLTLNRAYARSVADFAALQIAFGHGDEEMFVTAAGIPWFMTLFGRDSLIAAYQSLPFFPQAAKGVLRALARLQGTQVDMLRVEEPGKILHEWRTPTFTGTRHSSALFPYFGTIDATPLFLILLAKTYEVTGDLPLMRELYTPALRALEWMDHYGDRDGDGYLEYIKEAEWGLDNQGWKDSGDALRYADGRLAAPPIALCEVQGYAYAARLGMARISEALGEQAHAERLRAESAQLKERFNRDFWMPDRAFYAFALDGEKRQVDALTSNPGHLLWTGIVDSEKAAAVARHLLGPELFSGWGIRTMGNREGGYNPISYHCGSVWPHDNSLIAAGLARYGFTQEAGRIISGLLRALDYYPDDRLPELFGGLGIDEAPFPVEYPAACRPQAWAAGSILLLISAMAAPDTAGEPTTATPFLAPGVNHLHIRGVWVNGQPSTVEVTREG